ncbi:MAG: acyl carrier protein [bacterium]
MTPNDHAASRYVERVAAAVRDVAGLPAETQLDATTRLVGGGLALDSVVLLEVSLALEAEFACRIDEADLRPPHIDTIGSLAALIRGKSGG